jgi:putative transcriptional regulator|tara:strand:+ start:133 stop:711 length:579 start_codon:yes stop_codon:yes gene_type:complete
MKTYTDGKILIAPPRMTDWRFAKSLIYIWKHDVGGASGTILNKRVQAPTFSQICEEGGVKRNEGVNPPIFYGGPLMTNLVGCLHSLDYKIPATIKAHNDLGFTFDKKIIEDIAIGEGPQKYLLSIGFSSWTAGQLEEEFEAAPPRRPTSSWLVMDYDPTVIFGPKMQDLWDSCVAQCIEKTTKSITNKFFKN